jgi:hypothetical protein
VAPPPAMAPQRRFVGRRGLCACKAAWT